MVEEYKVYRPEWTCGKYNKEHKCAIYYNLIEGISYYFEDESAEIINEILSVGRNGSIDMIELSKKLKISEKSLVPFFEVLKEKNLLIPAVYSKVDIMVYRSICKQLRKEEAKSFNKPYVDPSIADMDSAEIDYTLKVNGIMSVMFELTYTCSEQCIHCYNIGAAHTKNEISHRADRVELNINDYKRIIDELEELGLFRVCITGGDPFSKAIVWEILEYLYKKDIAFDIFTNGQRLQGFEERLAFLYPKLVGVSIYSTDARIHDSITRVKGSLSKSITVMKTLSEYAIPMYLKCCVIKINKDSYKSVYKLAEEVNAAPQIEINVTDSLDGNKYVSQHLRLDEPEYEVVMQDKHVSLYVGPDVLDIIGQPKSIEANACKAGRNTFNITPEGNLIPCCSFHLVLGNLKKQTIKEILDKNEILDWWLNLKLKSYEVCGRYDYCAFCNLCPGMNYAEHGTPLKPAENSCFLAKIRYNLYNKIKGDV